LVALAIIGSLFWSKSSIETVSTQTAPAEAPLVIQATVTVPATLTVAAAKTAEPEPKAMDKVALISGNNLWTMDQDGSNLLQITNDRQPKINLDWLPDGSGLVYMQGKCAYSVALASQKISKLACFNNANAFEGFRISPDGKQVAIVVDRQLFVRPFDVKALSTMTDKSGLVAQKGCLVYGKVRVRNVLWSKDGKKVAILFLLGSGKVVSETLRVMDISRCSAGDPLTLDEFPGDRFTPEGYVDTHTLPSYAWDGEDLFLFNTFKRNDGFGELYLYDMSTGIAKKINPMAGQCCYRDARFSPDGTSIIFAYQDYSKGANSETQVYYLPLDQVGKNFDVKPVKLPLNFFPTSREKPQFALWALQP